MDKQKTGLLSRSTNMNILALLTLLFSLKLFSGWGGTTEQSLLGLPFSRPPTPCLDLDMCLTAAHDIDSISAMEERSVRCCNSSSQLGMNQSSSVYPRYDKGRAIPKWARAKYSTYGFSRLHQEILDFAGYVEPNREDDFIRRFAFQKLVEHVKFLWQDADVQPFGSSVYHMALPDSDIDATINLPSVAVDRHLSVQLFSKLARHLQQSGFASSVEVVSRTRVPVLKFKDTLFGFKFDVSLDNYHGIHQTAYMGVRTKQLPGLRPLFVALKAFLVQNNISTARDGGINSLMLISMVGSFLETNPRYQRSPKTANLGHLMIDFLRLYSDGFLFDEFGISLMKERPIFKREEFALKYIDEAPLAVLDPSSFFDGTVFDVGRVAWNYSNIRPIFRKALKTLRSRVYVSKSLPSRTALSLGRTRPFFILTSLIKPDPAMDWRRARNRFVYRRVFEEGRERPSDSNAYAMELAMSWL